MLPACSVPTLITSMCCIGALHGFTSEFLLPDQPFVVIWNHPSSTCEAHGINLNLSAWGIVMNKDDMFGGRNMRIYYNFGHWPEIDTKSGRIFYGGVPQVINQFDTHTHAQFHTHVISHHKDVMINNCFYAFFDS